MDSRVRMPLFMLLLSLLIASGMALGQPAGSSLAKSGNPCLAQTFAAPAVHAAQRGAPYMNLCDSHPGSTGLTAASQLAHRQTQAPGTPLSATSGDVDGDGVPDLVSGYAAGTAGVVRIHRGNVNALWPYGEAVRNGVPATFLPDVKDLAVPEAPDFIAVGDFNADGHADIVVAAQGGSALYFLLGDGHGGFSAPQAVRLPGAITAMAAGEVNRPDGLADIAVATSNGTLSQLLILESPRGAMRAEAEVFPMPATVTALAIGGVSGSPFSDVVAGAGSQLITLHGRDRRLSASTEALDVEQPAITSQAMPFTIKSLAIGGFSGLSNLAVLGDDGAIHLLENAGAVARIASAASAGDFQLPGSGQPTPARNAHSAATRKLALAQLAAQRRPLAAQRANAATSASPAEWTLRESVALPQTVSTSTRGAGQLVTGRITTAPTSDLLVLDGSARQVHVVANTAARDNIRKHAISASSLAQEQMTHLASLDVSSAPAAVLPMRLTKHALQSLVVLAADEAEPSILEAQAANVEVVTSTDPSKFADAITYVNSVAGILGSAELDFNIPLTDANCDPVTHVCTISPVSPRTGACNGLVTSISANVTVDGYTQPGSSPNTLATGDNAVILIRLDGAAATTPGGSGIQFFDTAGTVRGIDFTGWTTPDTSCQSGYAIGAIGVDVDGAGDYVEGNFIGVNPTGTVWMPNFLGVFVENGPEYGWSNSLAGNVIGGTTPQARNIISGNKEGGVFTYVQVDLTQIQGNYIGTDHTGTQQIQNADFGVYASEYTTIGGTTAGAGNVISGNPNLEVGMNSSAYGTSNTVQGNLIGTDATGTRKLSPGGTGISIVDNYKYALIGGTTPAARNVISGNYGAGIYLDMSWNNTIQGNYIGTDITGKVALPNGGAGILSDDAVITWFGGGKVANTFPACRNTIGGTVSGAGNLISGNTGDGISIAGSSQYYNGVIISAGQGTTLGNPILGNLIGTDVTGASGIANGGNGIHLLSATDTIYGTTGGSANTIGGNTDGAANTISYNTGHGIFIESGSTNQTVGNVIHNNGGAGVRVAAGNQNRISQNSIYGNGALGIDIDAAGENTSSHCQASITGANNLQNAPLLTAGTGSTYLSATATDPNGNTSEFSNTVAVSGSVFNALGSFDGLPNTTFTIEFFSSPAADASGYGQGETYLGSTTVTTPAACDATVNSPIDTTQADLSVSLAAEIIGIPYAIFSVGPALGQQSFGSTVVNHGAATAHNVVWTAQIPANLSIINSSQNSCTSPITTDRGSCSVSSNTVTCNLGAMNTGDTATISVPVEATTPGTATATATVTATEADPNLANNTASSSITIQQVMPSVHHLDPSPVIAGSGDTLVMIYGYSLFSTTTVTFNGTSLPVLGFYDNQTCYTSANPYRCEGLQVLVPAAMLTGTPADATVKLTNGADSATSTISGFVANACTYTNSASGLAISTSIGADGFVQQINTTVNAPTCSWTASTTVPWMTILDTNLAAGGSVTGGGIADVYIAPNTTTARTGNYNQAGQTLTFSQAAVPACTYSADTTSATLSAAAGGGTVNVTASDQSTCMWTANSYANWIKLPSNGVVGNGSMSYTVTANHGAPRTGWFIIAEQLYTVTQNPADSCYFTISANSATVPTAGATGSFTLTASSSSCAWTASVDQSFTTLTSASSGTGNATISYSVAQNSGDGRAATITVGNANGSYQAFSVNQLSANVCSTTLTPATVTVAAEGATGIFQLAESYSGCQWKAQSNNPTDLLLAWPSGTSSTPFGYTVTENRGAARVLTATVGCQTFIVNQAGAGAGNPVPVLSGLQPSSVAVGTTSFTLTVNGAGFVSGAAVLYNGVPRTTTYVSASQLTVALPDTDIDTVGTATVEVTNPVPGGGRSGALTFSITGQNPVPVITALSPASVGVGYRGQTSKGVGAPLQPDAVGSTGKAFTLTITGTGFTSSSVVSLNSTARTTTYVSTTTLTIPVTTTDDASAGLLSVVVTNPTPGGGTSNTKTLEIDNPVPAVTGISPNTATLGATNAFFNLSGSNFVTNSTVYVGGVLQPSVLISSSLLFVIIPLQDTAGALDVMVVNPTPGGGNSNTVTLTVAGTNPAPTVTALSPASATAGSGAFTLTVNGTNFLTSSVVNFNGSARATSYVSTTQLTALILASDVAAGGSFNVSVTNPTPGGGTASPIGFGVSNPAPAITSLSPASIPAASGAFTLTVNGTGFVSTSTVSFNGSAKPTTYVSPAQLTAAIAAADISASGSAPVVVTSPTPGGGASAAVNFTISAAVLPVAGLSPTSLSFTATSGTSSAAQDVTLSNTGTAALTITGINITGTGASSFSQSNGCGASLAAGSTCTISVTFAPSATGSYSATLSVADNAAGSPQTVTLSGTGTAPPAPVAGLSTTSLSFSTVSGTSSAAQNVTLSNTGNAALTITGITITGTGASSFSQSNGCGASLAAGSTCSIAVTFAPSSTGSYSATLSVADNATGSPQTVALSGTGTAAPAPVAGLSPTSLSFSATSGTSSVAQNVTLSNTGTAALTITGITITGTGASAFGQSNGCGASLAAGTTCTIAVTFSPTTAGSYSATLSVADNATGSPQTAALSGTSTAPVTPDYSLSGMPSTRTVAAGNSATYTISVASSGAAYNNAVSLSASGLPTGATATFTPSSVTPGGGTATSTLTIQTVSSTQKAGLRGARPWTQVLPAVLLSFGCVGLAFCVRSRGGKRQALAVLLLLAIVLCLFAASCGGGFAMSPSITSHTYTVTVTGSYGETQHSTTVTLIVQE